MKKKLVRLSPKNSFDGVSRSEQEALAVAYEELYDYLLLERDEAEDWSVINVRRQGNRTVR